MCFLSIKEEKCKFVYPWSWQCIQSSIFEVLLFLDALDLSVVYIFSSYGTQPIYNN